ncbi:hypothetical protein WAK64_21865 [Bacillus spongiae]|uniref:Menaquinol-cytochrome c reductase cytochrome b subunit n=1 Tax=Bacillus spongiae TaxID=2683610 RepID=A0ABU8HK57_9BACI
MKVILSAVLGSVVIHILYFISTMIIGYIKTKKYTPDMESSWGKVDTLQNKVEFGSTISPILYFVSFVGVTLICGVIIILSSKIFP